MLSIVGDIDSYVDGACDLSMEVKIVHMRPYLYEGIPREDLFISPTC